MPHPGVKEKPSAEELRAFVAQDWTLDEIGEEYGVTGTSVRRWMIAEGVDRRPTGRKKQKAVAVAVPAAFLIWVEERKARGA